MVQMYLEQIESVLEITDRSLPKNMEIKGVSIDSRTTQPGNLFVAIPGQRVNGHDYVQAALQRGAVAALVTHRVAADLPQIVVPDTVEALGKLAYAWRQQFNIPFVAVTGSNGKTTLKNMIASILTIACGNNPDRVLATQGTLNNHLGLPLTLLRLNYDHQYAVIEMGMNHFGEIDYLTKLTCPQTAVITNAAAAHLEGVGDLAGVAKAKAEIFNGLPNNGCAVLNRDDAFFDYWRKQLGSRSYLSFGLHPAADVTVSFHSENACRITLHTPRGNIDITLPLLGKHNILNTLAATAVALNLNIDLAHIKSGLEATSPAKGRLQPHILANGVVVIDDTYNANPFSLLAAVETLASFTGKKILVLGDMRELGQLALQLHQEAGENIRKAGIDYLFTYGELSEHTAQSFGEGAYHFNEQEKLVTALKPFLYNQTTILIKGSRSMHMETVVAGLVG